MVRHVAAPRLIAEVLRHAGHARRGARYFLDNACKVAAARRGTSGVDPDTVRTLLEAYYHHVAPEDLSAATPRTSTARR